MSETKDLLRVIAEALLDSNDISYEAKCEIAQALAEHGKVTRKKFQPPTEQEVEKFFAEQEVMFPAEHSKKFYLFYGSKDWMVGKNKMKNWKLAAARWAMDLPKINNLVSKNRIVV
jgi:hypothetical protein